MFSRIKKSKRKLIGFIIACVFSLVVTPYVNAISTTETALKKFEAYGLYQCMNNRFKEEFTASEVKEYQPLVSYLIQEDLLNEKPNNVSSTDDDYVVLPAGNGFDEDDKTSCVGLMRKLLNIEDNESSGSFSSLLEKFGYIKKEEDGKTNACVIYKFQTKENAEYNDLGAIKYCDKVKNGAIDADSSPTITYVGHANRDKLSGDDSFVYRGNIDVGKDGTLMYYAHNGPDPDVAFDQLQNPIRSGGVERKGSFETVSERLGDEIGKLFKNNNEVIYVSDGSTALHYAGMEKDDSNESVDGTNSYYLDKKESFNTASKNLLGDAFSSEDGFTFTNASQIAGLYQSYILSYWNADTTCADTEEALENEAQSLVKSEYEKTKLYNSNGTAQYCYVRPQVNNENTVYGVSNRGTPDGINKKSFKDVAKWLLDYGPETIDTADLVTVKDSSEKSEESGEDTCRNSKGAESFGWIVCPLMSWLGKQAEDFYNDTVEPSLAVEPELFNAGGNGDMGSVRQAWESFRDLANIAFIILLLIVIFSQVTGVGIDNYGIKKILPKLIVAAVLINLSYLICLILIDLSNILGNGLQEFFNGLSKALGNNGEVVLMAVDDMKFAGGATEATIGSKVAGIGVLGALVGVTGLAVWANPAIVLSLLIGAVGVAVSMFFLFILLAARKALIVILVAISPLAFVCYMLPNTKSLFDKWKKLFEGMLLVYPIAGLLVGAGDYVSRILLKGSGGFFSWITAMVVGVMPVFFLPMVIKGAFSAMGKVGGMLTGLGAGASKATQKQIMGRGGEIAKKVGSTDTFRGIRNTVGMKSPIATKRMRARAVQDQAALMKERSARERLSDNIDTRLASIASAEEAKAVDEATSQRLSLMQSSGSEGGIRLGRGIKDATEIAVPFTLSNAAKRMEELEIKSRTEGLSGAEQQEVAALARGMVGMKGGAGALGNIIRGSGGVVKDRGGNVVSQGLNTSFMNTMGEIYARDSAVQSKLNEKDAGASAFTEQFMPGGNGSSAVPEQREMFASGFSGYQKTEEYGKAVNKRLKTYEAGLNQGGTAVDEYIKSLRKDDMQRIMNDDNLLNSLDRDVRSNVEEHAATLGVTKAPQNVRFIGSDPYGATTSGVTESGTGGLDSAGGLGGASGTGSASRDGGSTQLDVRRSPELKVTNLESEFTRLGQTGGRNRG